jgi:hypothetical protein
VPVEEQTALLCAGSERVLVIESARSRTTRGGSRDSCQEIEDPPLSFQKKVSNVTLGDVLKMRSSV